MAKKLSEKKPPQNQKGKTTKPSATSTDKKKKSKRVEKPEWFTKKPTDVHKKVSWNNREWNWCGRDTGGKCESYVIHKPADCKGLKCTGPTPSNKLRKKIKLKAEETISPNEDDTPYNDGFML